MSEVSLHMIRSLSFESLIRDPADDLWAVCDAMANENLLLFVVSCAASDTLNYKTSVTVMGMRVTASQAITEYLLTEWFPAPGRSVGDELPTIAELCDQFDIGGVQTVRDGVQPLKDAGYVETRYAPTRRWVVRELPPAVRTPVSSALDQIQGGLVVARDALNAAISAIDRLRPCGASLTPALAPEDRRHRVGPVS